MTTVGGPGGSRARASVPAEIARLGFADPHRALALLSDPAVAALIDTRDRVEEGGLAESIAEVPDPDGALLGLVRFMETVDADPSLTAPVTAALREPGPARSRLLAVLGSSATLADHLVAHPEQWSAVVAAGPLEVGEQVARLVAAVRHPDDAPPADALRIAYREQLLGIAAVDLTAPDPVAALPGTAAALADLAQAALEAALVVATDEAGPDAARTRLAVIAMGKAGGRELNYLSDVDVIFVAEPADGAAEEESTAAATDLATRMMRICSASTAAGTRWQVDAALRPEGKAGPLVRTVASHRAYYERWAKTWEFQALLKARPVAGHTEVGRAYCDAVQPMVWQASSRENFVDDVQAMRRRVEQHLPAAEAGRQLKLGPGGLRDVEFSVQLLQLVHGRADDTLRGASTLDALEALAVGGYVGREDAAVLDEAYRYLRVLEHRIQLYRLRRTHLMPTTDADLRRLGRALGHRSAPAETVVAEWRARQREVRRLHERIFYRPLLSAVARLSDQHARLTPDAARERLAALGFRDPRGALRHLEALTAGISRRAAIQRQLLPVMLGWFADEADPDAGLLAFRTISEELGSTHWYLRLLRDEGSAAERLAHILARSRFAADLLAQAPECVRFLGDPAGLQPRTREELLRRMRAAAGRKDDAGSAVLAARTIRRSELFRVAVADLFGVLTKDEVGRAMADLTCALLDVTLEACLRDIVTRGGAPALTRLLVVGMGRLGGREQGYGSDADVLFVHDPEPGADQVAAQQQAMEVVRALVRLLGQPGPDPRLDVDASLRPEGRNGPLVRSLSSYREYYARWSLVWEAQALLRAAPVAGDAGVAARFVALVDPIRYPDGGLDAAQVREIRTLKARVEAERLPRGADPKTHFKLGHGGLSDVEWVVQLVQLRHAHAHPALRTPSTNDALDAAGELGLVDPGRAADLAAAWHLASAMRGAGVLFRGRPIDAVPTNDRDADGIARILGLPPGSGQELRERYRRLARRARSAFESEFYDRS
ncbi:MAG: bifunctional [glutamine synthetase] adenylyltransferase/[glutamine synthetase]-adenylyl-L-tyrosine phosphorylase [Phycicoccus sp.]